MMFGQSKDWREEIVHKSNPSRSRRRTNDTTGGPGFPFGGRQSIGKSIINNRPPWRGARLGLFVAGTMYASTQTALANTCEHLQSPGERRG